MAGSHVVIAGGGAAGFFAAITCAELSPNAKICILEKSPEFLTKVRISGGGRCNVTHACFDTREFALRFPRGDQALLGPLKRFQASDTVDWFEARGVKLKTEEDGRMFPVSDSSDTIVQCLLEAARKAGVELRANEGVESVRRAQTQAADQGGFQVTTTKEDHLECGSLLIATGGCRTEALAKVPCSLGHTLRPPVPSLFTFHIKEKWLPELAGTSLPAARLSVPGTDLRETGPMLITHWGLSGPAILRLSAWGARKLHEQEYRFSLRVCWLPEKSIEEAGVELQARRKQFAARLVSNCPIAPLTARLWEQLVLAAGISPETRWASLGRAQMHRLGEQLFRTEFQVVGKSLNKDEFVTCGGIPLEEVNLKTMESRACPGLFFAGEVLDIDGITGGFNFQAAWTTGYLAGMAMAERS
jgi:predicted Rossmann fold flavoprotein